MTAFEHRLPAAYIEHEVQVDLVGCGGNGSQMLTGLARLDRALRALGHPGLRVTAWDPDAVSEANVGRQLFSPSDVGHNKAVLLVHRLNAFYGLAWGAKPYRFYLEDGRGERRGRLVISCVDSRAARHDIRTMLRSDWSHCYWMDLGNREADGQVVLGEVGRHSNRDPRLPTAPELFPEIVDATKDDDGAPSCSLAEALERQELFVNQAVATQALAILWMLFRFGRIAWHGAFVNVRSGRVQPLAVDPAAWGRLRVRPTPPPPRKRRSPKS